MVEIQYVILIIKYQKTLHFNLILLIYCIILNKRCPLLCIGAGKRYAFKWSPNRTTNVKSKLLACKQKIKFLQYRILQYNLLVWVIGIKM